MDQQPPSLALQEEGVGVAGLKVLSPVDLAGRQTVAEHLRHIFLRHLHAADAAAVPQVVRPVLKVVAVAALVVHPGAAVALGLPLGVVGTVVPLEVADAHPELPGGVLGEVVGQPLPVEPQAEAVPADQPAVMIDGVEMLPEMHGGLLRSEFVQPSRRWARVCPRGVSKPRARYIPSSQGAQVTVRLAMPSSRHQSRAA